MKGFLKMSYDRIGPILTGYMSIVDRLLTKFNLSSNFQKDDVHDRNTKARLGSLAIQLRRCIGKSHRPSPVVYCVAPAVLDTTLGDRLLDRRFAESRDSI